MPTASSRFFRALADPASFALTFELVPSRGGRSREHTRALEFARHAAADGRLQAVSITENAGGHAALSPEVLGTEIRDLGLEIIVHLSCKDKNRNQMESQLFAWDRLGLRNLLVITGDYPKPGYQGLPKPVFDLDSVHALDLISRMNRGDFHHRGENGRTRIQPTNFVKGVALSPFKRSEAELLMQYAKLHRKAAAGADFIITQVGYDARKFHEVLLYLRQHGLGHLPVLGNVFIPNLAVAEFMYRGGIPGCVLTEPLYRRIMAEAAAPDRGKGARLERAAKLLAILKGMGYAGAHLGGPGLSFSDVAQVLDQAEALAGDWQSLIPEMSYWHPDGFYYYRKQPIVGLNLPDPAPRPPGRSLVLSHAAAQAVHRLAFAPTGPLFKPMSRLCLAWDDSRLGPSLSHLEHLLKFIAFGCLNCGDCTLSELAFICPQSSCAKYLLNGACGGSRDGWCEVYPGRKRCMYVLVYERLKAAPKLDSMHRGLIPPRNWSLNNTSSWVNYFRSLG